MKKILKTFLKSKKLKPSIERARLKLALLKERKEFRDFYIAFKEDPYSFIPGPRKPGEKAQDYRKRQKELSQKGGPFLEDFLIKFGMNPNFLFCHFSDEIPIDQILILFDLNRDFPESDFSETLVPRMPFSWRKYFSEGLSSLFFKPAITQLKIAGHSSYFEHISGQNWKTFDPSQIQASERILRVDIGRRKKDLLQEFELFIDGTRAVQKELKAAVVSYQEWEPENDRQSKAIWRNLEIWKRRRQRKPFLDISKEFRITEENAKKNFYNIHSLITGRSYEPESYRRDYWIIRKPELKKSCATCPDRNSCTILCPDVLNFVEQDQAKQKEIFWEDLKSPSRK